MNLKDAFRYQNYLTKICDGALNVMLDPKYHVKYTKLHKRSEAVKDAEDFVEITENYPGSYTINDYVDFVCFLVLEKNNLSTAISEAKKKSTFSIDAALDVNKMIRSVALRLESVIRSSKSQENISNSNKVKTGTGYVFNSEGNQTPYTYTIESSCEIAYDIEKVSNTFKTISMMANHYSDEVDRNIINTEVDYDPPFQLTDDLDDCLKKYLMKMIDTKNSINDMTM